MHLSIILTALVAAAAAAPTANRIIEALEKRELEPDFRSLYDWSGLAEGLEKREPEPLGREYHHSGLAEGLEKRDS